MDYRKYLEGLIKEGIVTHSTKDIMTLDSGVFLKHDLLKSMKQARMMGLIERKLEMSATYYISDIADYYNDQEALVEGCRELQQLGHEIGWLSGMLNYQFDTESDPIKYLKNELAFFRLNGIKIIGVSNYNNSHCQQYGYTNGYFWNHTPKGGRYPNYEGMREMKFVKANLDDFGLQYDCSMVQSDNGKMKYGAFNYEPMMDFNAYESDTGPKSHVEKWINNFLNYKIDKSKKTVISIHPINWKVDING